MKKIAIFHLTLAGGGHKRAALTLQEELKKEGIKVEVIDSLEFINSNFHKVLGVLRKIHLKCNALLGRSYYENRFVQNILLRINKAFLKLNSKMFADYIKKEKINLAICTHSSSLKIMEYAKEKYNFKLVGVLTDFYCNPMWISDKTDLYIVPKGIKEQLVKMGVKSDRIKEAGIPITQEVSINYNPLLIKEEMGFNKKIPIITIMAGTEGAVKINKIFNLINGINKEFQLIIICGKNKDLFKQLNNKIRKNKDYRNIKVLSYCEKMGKIYSITDLLISKAGGLTSQEAIIRKLPIIIFGYVRGIEEKNRDYIVKNKYGLYTKDEKQFVKIVSKKIDTIYNEKYNKSSSKILISYENPTIEIVKEIKKLA